MPFFRKRKDGNGTGGIAVIGVCSRHAGKGPLSVDAADRLPDRADGSARQTRRLPGTSDINPCGAG